jgi:type VI secretion system secreted protein Hcp
MSFYFYMKVTGTSQGPFASDSPHAGDGRSLCYGFHFKGAANNDPTRGAANAARSHEPLLVLKAWGPSSPQFAQAFWSNEVLKEVVFDFVRSQESGPKEAAFEQIILKGATVVSLERKAGPDVTLPEGAPFELEEIGFRFEEMSIKSVPAKIVANYDWKNRS